MAVELWGRHATAADQAKLRAIATSPDTLPQDRMTALRGVGAASDRKILAAALDWTLPDAVKVQDLGYVFGAANAHRDNRPLVVSWVRDHWNALRAKLPGPLGRSLAWNAGLGCTQSDLDQSKTFFGPKIKDLEGADRIYEQAIEISSICVAQHQQLGSSLSKALRPAVK